MDITLQLAFKVTSKKCPEKSLRLIKNSKLETQCKKLVTQVELDVKTAYLYLNRFLLLRNRF